MNKNIIIIVLVLALIGFGMYHVHAMDVARNSGFNAGEFEGRIKGFEDGASLGVPSEKWPEGNYIVWTTFSDSYLNDVTGTQKGTWCYDYESIVVIPICEDGTSRGYPRLLKRPEIESPSESCVLTAYCSE